MLVELIMRGLIYTYLLNVFSTSNTKRRTKCSKVQMTDAPEQWRGIAGLSSLLGMTILYQNISSSHLSEVVAYSVNV